MTTVAISGLPVATVINAADIVPFVQAGTTKSISKTLLFTSPTMVTPVLGTVASGNISACTSTSMVMVTPVLGAATGTSFQGIIGNVTAAAGSFTTLGATGAITSSGTTSSSSVASSNSEQGANHATLSMKVANNNGGYVNWYNAAGVPRWGIYSLMGAAGEQTNLRIRDLAGGDDILNISTTGLTVFGITGTPAAATTIASAATIAPIKGITFISGTAAVVTITAIAPFTTGGGTITLIPTGIFTWTAAGNIALAGTAVVSRALTMTYDSTTTKWYPSYV
jgi:hypothetical protein